MICCNNVNAQSPCESDDICVVQFNAGFNEANKVSWVNELNECSTKFIDIQKDAAAAGKYTLYSSMMPYVLV